MQMGKMLISLVVLVATNQFRPLLNDLYEGKALILALGLTGTIGQVN